MIRTTESSVVVVVRDGELGASSGNTSSSFITLIRIATDAVVPVVSHRCISLGIDREQILRHAHRSTTTAHVVYGVLVYDNGMNDRSYSKNVYHIIKNS